MSAGRLVIVWALAVAGIAAMAVGVDLLERHTTREPLDRPARVLLTLGFALLTLAAILARP